MQSLGQSRRIQVYDSKNLRLEFNALQSTVSIAPSSSDGHHIAFDKRSTEAISRHRNISTNLLNKALRGFEKRHWWPQYQGNFYDSRIAISLPGLR